MTEPIFTCSACGLLCAATAPQDRLAIQACSRNRRLSDLPRNVPLPWLESKQAVDEITRASAEQIHLLLSGARRPLVVLDGADVLTTRAAIELAWKHKATVSVPQSIGCRVVKNVEISDGWLGTTLADMAEHSQLMITLGTSWLSQTPQLARRWIRGGVDPHSQTAASVPLQAWWHIAANPASTGTSGTGTSGAGTSGTALSTDYEHSMATDAVPDQWLKLSQSLWYPLFTHAVSLLRNSTGSERFTNVYTENPIDNYDDCLRALVAAIERSSNTTVVWETSELSEPNDEMLVHRLWNLAQVRSQKARFNLLPISADSGRETARETLLWLTGCDSVATASANGWNGTERPLAEFDGDWRPGFDSVLLIRNTPTTPLNSMDWNMALCDPTLVRAQTTSQKLIPVGLVGKEDEGFLLRGDRGMFQFVSAAHERPMDRTFTGSQKLVARDVLRYASKLAPHREASFKFPNHSDRQSRKNLPSLISDRELRP